MVVPGCERCPRRSSNSPRAVPWEFTLPWNVPILRPSVVPVRDDRGLGSACAKAVAVGISPDVGTNVTAKIQNVCGNSAVGRRPSGRPGGARTRPSKPSTPPRNGRAVSVPLLRRKLQPSPRLRRRVVTQQKFFAQPLCARPGCYEAAPKRGCHQAHYCGADCRQAVGRVRERERKWRCRGTFRGRRQRAQEYQAAAARRGGQPGPPNDSTRPTPPS